MNWSLGLRRGKNDKADSKDIARYLFLHQHEIELSKLPSDRLLKIKSLLSLRHRIIKSKKGLRVAQKEINTFSTKEIAKQISKQTDKVCKPMKQATTTVEQEIRRLIQEDVELNRIYSLIVSVKGAALITAAYLLVYTVGFTAFVNSRKFATYIGFSPFAQTSGTSVNKPAKVSHLAHKKLKGVISCAASSAQLYDKELNAYYHRKLAEGKNKYSVRNAVCNKFIHRIFAVVKRGTPYVELTQYKA